MAEKFFIFLISFQLLFFSGFFLSKSEINKENNENILNYDFTPFKFISTPNDLIIMRINELYNNKNITIGANGFVI